MFIDASPGGRIVIRMDLNEARELAEMLEAVSNDPFRRAEDLARDLRATFGIAACNNV